MQLHELKPIHKRKRGKRVGRGGKRGTFSGRGSKGQAARAGRRLKPMIRTLIKRYPKLRGYQFKSLQTKPAIVDVRTLDKKFKSGDMISPETLLKQKLIRRIKGKTPAVKILGKSKLTQPLAVEGCQISKSARESITQAGGTIK